MPNISYREALNQALAEEMRRDDRVLIVGEDVGLYDGAYKVTHGLLQEFGPRRVKDAPISESAIPDTSAAMRLPSSIAFSIELDLSTSSAVGRVMAPRRSRLMPGVALPLRPPVPPQLVNRDVLENPAFRRKLERWRKAS